MSEKETPQSLSEEEGLRMTRMVNKVSAQIHAKAKGEGLRQVCVDEDGEIIPGMSLGDHLAHIDAGGRVVMVYHYEKTKP